MRTEAAIRTREHPAEKYAHDAASGKIVVSRFVQLAAKRHLQDLAEGGRRGLRFDPAAAQYVLDFFRLLRHYRGSEWVGKPFELQPWQQFILWCVYGWKKSNGLRRFRTAHVEVAKGNGKTPLGAGIGLYMLSADGEHGAEVYCAATKKDQARILFGDAIGFRDKSPGLAKHIQKFRDNLSIASLNAKFQPLGADQDTLDGPRPHCLLLDELHAWKTRALLDVLEEGLDKCLQSIAWRLTTAGPNRPGSVYMDEHEYAVRTLESAYPSADDSLFAYIACIDEQDDWKNEKVWIKANPNLGVSVPIDALRVRAAKAYAQLSYLNSFLRFRLNRRTQSTTAAIDIRKWNECVGFSLAGKDPKILRAEVMAQLSAEKRRCFAALDLSSKVDLTALMLAFEPDPDAVDAPWVLLPWFWMPKDNIAERAREDRVAYDIWEREGFIAGTPGNFIDQDFIVAEIVKLRAMFNFSENAETGNPEIAFDPWNSSQAAVDLQNEGFTVAEHRQGFKSLSEPTKSFLGMVPAKKIAHLAHPVLSWQAGNLMVVTDPAGNIKPTKEDPSKKIDGMVAAIMALGRGLTSAPDESSPYDEGKGILFV
ncbi:MAG: terminase large subunit [Candidatus Acidiferrales bacterium]